MAMIVAGNGTGGLASQSAHSARQGGAGAEAQAARGAVEQRQLLARHFPQHPHQDPRDRIHPEEVAIAPRHTHPPLQGLESPASHTVPDDSEV